MTVSNAGDSKNNGSRIAGLIFEGTKIFMAGGSSVFNYGVNQDVTDSWDCTHNASKNNIDFSNRTDFFIGEYF